ncbi:MAG: sulfurtransferase, partial [Verrucomicrobia bacterium]|nr:sulfurtransferase [Verrucomicrobiota bacterium]
MKHSPGFLSMVQEAATRVKELTLEQARERLQASPETLLVDVREDREWSAGHATGALHLGKGVLERDIEQAIPDNSRPVI